MQLPLQQIKATLERGQVVVLPTDTIYGLAASIRQPAALAILAALKQRPADKPFIILIADLDDLRQFPITLTPAQLKTLGTLWPGPVSVVLGPTAFRLPAPAWLRDLLRLTGPLAAPSANPNGQPPAATIEEARRYFGDQISLYVQGGRLTGKASTLVQLEPDGATTILRV